MTIAYLSITNKYLNRIEISRFFNDDLHYSVNLYGKLAKWLDKEIHFGFISDEFFRKSNKIEDDDLLYILEQRYCEWRFRVDVY